jgi:hypothetical protein
MSSDAELHFTGSGRERARGRRWRCAGAKPSPSLSDRWLSRKPGCRKVGRTAENAAFGDGDLTSVTSHVTQTGDDAVFLILISAIDDSPNGIYTERFFYRTKTWTNESFSNEAISVFFLVLRFWHNLKWRQNLDWGVCAVQKKPQFLQLTRISLLDFANFLTLRQKKNLWKNLAATFRSQQKVCHHPPFRSIFFHQKVIANLMHFSFEHPLEYLRCLGLGQK